MASKDLSPTPWKFSWDEDILDATDSKIAEVIGDKRIKNDVANGHLMAAAPELLAVCEELVNLEDTGSALADLIERAKAAVKKANGEA